MQGWVQRPFEWREYNVGEDLGEETESVRVSSHPITVLTNCCLPSTSLDSTEL